MRPSSYTEEVAKKAKEYIEDYEDYGHAFPSIVGLCKALNRGKSTIYDWSNPEHASYQEGFSDILEEIKETQELVAWNKGMKNEYNSNLVKLLLGKHGYSDKSEVDSKVSVFAQVSDEIGEDDWEEEHS